MSLLLLRNASAFPVQTGAPFIVLTASLANITVTKSFSKDFTVFVERTGYLDVVTLGVTGLPANVTASYPEGQTMPNGVDSRTVRISAASNAAVVAGAAITVTASGPGVASVGLGRTLNVVDSSSVTPVYTCNFDSVADGTNSTSGMAPLNDASWGYWATLTSNRVCADSNTAVLPVGYPGAISANNAFRFRYVATASDADSTSEARFYLYNPQPELWIEYYLFVPANYDHRNVSGTDNNKFFRIWREPSEYGDAAVKFGLEAGVTGNSKVSTAMIGATNDDTNTSTYYYLSEGQTLISADGPMVIGEWNLVRWHIKCATSRSVADGILNLTINGTELYSTTTGAFGVSTTAFANQSAYMKSMYFMGYSNSGYTDTTLFLMDDLKMWNQNPGW